MREDEAGSRTLAERILAYESGDDPGLARVAAAERACSKLRDSLRRAVGEAGVSAVIARAAKITRADFPFVLVTATPGQTECLGELRESLNGQDPTQVAEALTVLIANSLEVLYSLLGRDLTHRLVAHAWPDIRIR